MTGESIQRVRIYLNERDSREGMALYIAVLERLRREGATGATALRGMAGFGPGHRMRAIGVSGVADAQPVVIEWVDRVDRVARIMPMLDDLLEQALVTIEDLRAYRARLRSSGPFGSATAGEVLDTGAQAASQETSLRDAMRDFLATQQPILPILDEQRHLVAVLNSMDIVRRAALPLPLAVLRALQPEERNGVLQTLPDRPLSELIADEPRNAYIQAAIPQVVATLIEWGLDALPVLDRDGSYVGIIGENQALRAALHATPTEDAAVRDAEAPPVVRLLMQTSIPALLASTDTPTGLRQLLASQHQYFVLIEQGAPVAMLDFATVLTTMEAPLRYAWLQAVRTPTVNPALPGADPEQSVLAFAAPIQSIPEMASQNDAIQVMLEGNHERLAVTNEAGQLVGLLAKRTLLRALAQLSA